MLIGVISDTHGTLHPGLKPAFLLAGVDLLLHAGDVGSQQVLDELELIAPVFAVRGNVDTAGEVSKLPMEFDAVLSGLRIYVTHVGFPPEAWFKRLLLPRPGVVIYGHSHIPHIQTIGETLFLNPGSAGTRRRFGGGLSAALLSLEGNAAAAELITLAEGTND